MERCRLFFASVTLKEYRTDSNVASASTPWGNIETQIQEIHDEVDAYKQDALDVLDEIDDAVGDYL